MPDSSNTGWRNASFRGFADYMQTQEFTFVLDQLIDWAHHLVVVILSEEAVSCRCHQSLGRSIVRKIVVREIIGPESVRIHTIIPWATVVGIEIKYPGIAY